MALERIGVFGPTESGKTTLAKAIVENRYRKAGIKSLVLDPHLESWPASATVYADELEFWSNVWNTEGRMIVVDEASSTVARDKSLIPAFTKIRHKLHHLMVIGHNGTDLLPVMRDSLTQIFLFRQSKKAAAMWVEVFACEDLMKCTTLDRYQFLYYSSFGVAQIQKLELGRKAA